MTKCTSLYSFAQSVTPFVLFLYRFRRCQNLPFLLFKLQYTFTSRPMCKTWEIYCVTLMELTMSGHRSYTTGPSTFLRIQITAWRHITLLLVTCSILTVSADSDKDLIDKIYNCAGQTTSAPPPPSPPPPLPIKEAVEERGLRLLLWLYCIMTATHTRYCSVHWQLLLQSQLQLHLLP